MDGAFDNEIMHESNEALVKHITGLKAKLAEAGERAENSNEQLVTSRTLAFQEMQALRAENKRLQELGDAMAHSISRAECLENEVMTARAYWIANKHRVTPDAAGTETSEGNDD